MLRLNNSQTPLRTITVMAVTRQATFAPRGVEDPPPTLNTDNAVYPFPFRVAVVRWPTDDPVAETER